MATTFEGTIEVKRISEYLAKLTALTGYKFIIDKSSDAQSYSLTFDDLNSNLLHNDLASKQGGTSGEYYHITAAELAKLGNLKVWNAASPVTISGSEVYDLDFDVDFQEVIIDEGAITNMTYSNLTGNLGKPILRVFRTVVGTETIAITDTDIRPTDNSEAFDLTAATENNFVIFPKNIGSGTEKFTYSNTVLTP